MAMLFQAAAVRLGIATGMDLAQACRQHYSRAVNAMLWLLCEIAIVACNLAEVLGMAIGLNLLFGLPLLAGVCLTVLDVLLILALQSRGFRCLEAVVIGLVALIVGCFAVAARRWLQPPAGRRARRLRAARQIVANPAMLYLAVGIVGATVMPHNLYLHSSIVQTRVTGDTPRRKREAIRFATFDSTVALTLALLVNAGILIVAAGVFHRAGQRRVTELSEAYRLLSPLLGIGIASAVFGVALLASGLSASVTGTLAGQIVMEGFLRIRLSRGARALLTRSLAIVPAVLAIAWYGEPRRRRAADLQPGRAEPAAAVRDRAAAALHDQPPALGRPGLRHQDLGAAVERRRAGDRTQRLAAAAVRVRLTTGHLGRCDPRRRQRAGAAFSICTAFAISATTPSPSSSSASGILRSSRFSASRFITMMLMRRLIGFVRVLRRRAACSTPGPAPAACGLRAGRRRPARGATHWRGRLDSSQLL